MAKHAVFLHGPVGVGKTTLGKALAGRFSGEFIDGDDFTDPERPWYCSILKTSMAIVRSGLSVLEAADFVIIAYPLGCVNWIYFRRRFGDAGAKPFFINLRASYSAIVDKGRGRDFSPQEHARIQVMTSEGYGSRSFSDLVLDTDRASFATTLALLESEIRCMIAI